MAIIIAMRVVDSRFYEEFAVSDKERFLFLEDHPRISHFWMVESFDAAYQKRLDGVLSRHRHVSVFGFERFQEAAEKAGYELIFLDDPTPTFEWIRSLSDLPTVEIHSGFPNTIRGLLPFQVKAFNFAKDLPAAILNLSTGTGKTVIACALAEDQLQKGGFDVCLWVVKAHNKINTARMIERFIHRPSIIIDGDRPKREGQWQEAMAATTPIVVFNYEAFRIDSPLLEALITKKRILIVWDELPTKLRSRSTQLYRSVAKALYRSKARGVYYPSKQIRPAQLRQVMLSATPIEHSPEDFFNAVRLLDPTVYGSVKSFNNTYIAHRNMWGEPDRWRNLDLMGALASPITFQVEKTDPHISIQFPKILSEEHTLRLSHSQEKIYNALLNEVTRTRQPGANLVFDRDEILSVIQVLQYICDMPIAVLDSANKWTRTKGAEGSEVARKLVDLIGETPFIEAENVKVDALADLVNGEQIRPGHKKIVVFAPYNETVLPYLSDSFEIWKIPHVLYHGGLSTKEKQAAQDRFTEDPDCRVFLSSDAGSDSINLECASTVIHYSLPWAWSTLIQRQNRIHRITSKFKSVKYTTLVTADTVEDRKIDIILNKYQFHKAVLRGEIAEQSEFLRAKSELEFILFGEDHPA